VNDDNLERFGEIAEDMHVVILRGKKGTSLFLRQKQNGKRAVIDAVPLSDVLNRANKFDTGDGVDFEVYVKAVVTEKNDVSDDSFFETFMDNHDANKLANELNEGIKGKAPRWEAMSFEDVLG
jgi:hypothetical protein